MSVARVIDVDDRHCTVELLDGGRIARAVLSSDIVRFGIRVRPGHVVLVVDNEVVYRCSLAASEDVDLKAVLSRCLAEWQALSQRHVATGDPRRIVTDGYDRIAERYARWSRDEVVDAARPKYLALLLDSLPPGAAVLELGCGAGGPTTLQLAARFDLTGVDISEQQIDLARRAVPNATFVHADMTRLMLPARSFDAVASFYAFNHLPHGELPGLLERIAAWLRPGGVLVIALPSRYDPGTIEADWLGVPMYFSGYAESDIRRFLEQAGLSIVSLLPEPIVENGRPTLFLWLVAHGPTSMPRSRPGTPCG